MEIHCDVSDYLVESLKLGELDLVVGVTLGPVDIDPQHAWLDHPVWLGSQNCKFGERDAVPLLAHLRALLSKTNVGQPSSGRRPDEDCLSVPRSKRLG